MKLEDWEKTYLEAFNDRDVLQKQIDDYGGFAGWVLEGVLETKDIDGEEVTDHECLELIGVLVDAYLLAVAEGVDTQ